MNRLARRRIASSLVAAVLICPIIVAGPANAAPGDITTFAGKSRSSGDGGLATSAQLDSPETVAVDSSGNLVIADMRNNKVREVSAGVIKTIAGNGQTGYTGDGGPATSAQLYFPSAAVTDPAGNVYVADSVNQVVRRIDTGGTVTTFAGNGSSGFSGDGGPATSARLSSPSAVAIDASGNVLISDRNNHRIRRVDTGGTITTIVGTGIAGSIGDGGPATAARINHPEALSFDPTGSLLFVDQDNNKVRKVDTAGTITTFAGNGLSGSAGDGGLAISARLNDPEGVTVDSTGIVYIGDTDNNKIRRVDLAGTITTFAGTGVAGFGGDGGAATAAQMNDPKSVAVDASGNVFVADSQNDRIRMIDTLGNMSTVAGNGVTFSGDGGPATSADLSFPLAVAEDASGNIYIADLGNHRVRRVDTSGVITTVAGMGVPGALGDGGLAALAELNSPADVEVDSSGNLFIADYGNNKIRMVDTAGVITTVAGTGVPGALGDGGLATAAQLNSPVGTGLDPFGNLFIADSDNDKIRKVDTAGIITTVAGTGVPGSLGDGGLATAARLNSPLDVDFDATGNYLISDFANSKIRKVDTAGIITTAAGTGGFGFGGDGGPAISAQLAAPIGVTWDPIGNFFIADSFSNRIRKVNTAGNIFTVTGTGAFGFSGDGGPGLSAKLNIPGRVTLDAAGNFYVADSGNNRIRRVEALAGVSPPLLTATSPTSPGNNNSPTIIGFAEPGTTVKLYTDPSCSSAVAATGTDAQFAAPGLTVSVADNSSTTFYATATDLLGNFSPCSTSSITFEEDSIAPLVPTITTPPIDPGNDVTPSWSFTGDEPGGTFQCELTQGASTIFGFASCSSPHTFDLSAEVDETYTFSVRQVDDAGNTGPATSEDYTLDTSIPDAPALTVMPTDPGNDNGPSWSFTGELLATFRCELTKGAAVISALSICTSPRAYDLSAQTDGDYTFSVTQTDTAGNQSAFATDTYTLDTAPPDVPAITVVPTDPGNDPTPSWSFTGEVGATFECQLSQGATIISAFDTCVSSHTYDLSALADATYTFEVRQTDQAGNMGPSSSDDYLLDRILPAAPLLTLLPPDPGNDATPTWNFTGEAGAGFFCQLSQGATILSPYALCTSAHTIDLSAQPDGVYTFSTYQTDTAGNQGPTSTDDYTLDTTGPLVSIIVFPPDPGNDPTPTWSFTGEAGATFECQLSQGVTILSAFALCVSPHEYDLSAESDGIYTFTIRGIDALGNIGSGVSDNYTLDTTAPALPSITVAPTDPGNDPTPTWSFTGEPGASFECRLSQGATIISALGPCTSAQTFDLTAQLDGTYTFLVQQTDQAGNLGLPMSVDYTLDTTVPATPIVTSSPASPGIDQAPGWSFLGEAGATLECQLSRGATIISAFGACTSPKTYDLSAEPDATYTFTLRQRDPAGNVSPSVTRDYVLDAAPPDAPVFTSALPPDGSNPLPSWSFVGEPGATFECQLSQGSTTVSAWGPCTSPFAFDLTSLTDATYTLTVRAIDGFGRVGAPASNSYTIDRTPPAAPSPPRTARSSSGGSGPPGGFEGLIAEELGTQAPPPEVAQGTGSPASRGGRRGDNQASGVSETTLDAVQAFTAVSQALQFPFILLLLVVVFLIVQDRIDRSDPKLSLAPVYGDREIDFYPAPGMEDRTGPPQ